ncbi:o-succinylbenzoate synthase [Caloramator quimbayensis]|uniref:Dipeptide epimerase n=1 Tax=Caloramator quimbayensis TaxID=1147123 RepID=A0A1T4WFG1_9CLOT|nr:dipeptide epimerase [Caloramator quimbayensis]SKA75391.1 o-succinylbenzoate synthase [Caloramator quimbayensis]
MKIQDYKIYQADIPLKRPFKTALRTLKVLSTIIVEIITDTGEIGFGEASPTAVITGDTLGSIKESIENFIFPSIKGMDIDDFENILLKINKCMIKNYSPKAAVDIAVHDLFCQKYKMPLYRYFGGAKKEIETDITVSIGDEEKMAIEALEYVNKGYRILKIKVGIDSSLDIKRIQAIRDAVGYDIKIRLDANQGWKPKEAVRVIRKMEDMGLDIELVEQPVVYYDFEGLKYVTDNVDIPIMADESLFSPYDALKLLNMRACDILNVKLMKSGGLYNAQNILSIAQSCGVECMIGSMMESKVGITAASSLSAGKNIVTRSDLDASTLLSEDIAVGGVIIDGRNIKMSEDFGLGIKKVKNNLSLYE